MRIPRLNDAPYEPSDLSSSLQNDRRARIVEGELCSRVAGAWSVRLKLPEVGIPVPPQVPLQDIGRGVVRVEKEFTLCADVVLSKENQQIGFDAFPVRVPSGTKLSFSGIKPLSAFINVTARNEAIHSTVDSAMVQNS